MTSMPLDPSPVSTTEPLSEERVRLRGATKKLFFWFIPATLGPQFVWGGVLGNLLPVIVQVLSANDDAKVANLAVVTTIGAFISMISQPIAGVISDRIRSRFGRRAPIIIVGAVVGAIAIIGIAFSREIWQVAIAWAFVQAGFAFAWGPISAIVPDRVPVALRGAFSAIIGAMLMVGGIGGAVVAGSFVSVPTAGLVTIAIVSFALITLFVVFNPDSSSKDSENPPFSAAKFFSAFWVNPVVHRDFFWAFGGRVLLYAGYFMITGYNVYLLTDYVGLGDSGAAIAPLISAAGLPTILLSVGIAGPLSDRLGRRKVFVVIASVLVALGEIIPWVSPTVPGMIGMALVTGLGFGAFLSVDTALVTQVLPSEKDFGKDIGVLNIAATLPQTVAPAIAGVVVLSVGYVGLFPIAIILSIVGALFVLPIKSVR